MSGSVKPCDQRADLFLAPDGSLPWTSRDFGEAGLRPAFALGKNESVSRLIKERQRERGHSVHWGK